MKPSPERIDPAGGRKMDSGIDFKPIAIINAIQRELIKRCWQRLAETDRAATDIQTIGIDWINRNGPEVRRIIDTNPDLLPLYLSQPEKVLAKIEEQLEN